MSGSYSRPVQGGLLARITVTTDTGRFTSPISAAGLWSLTAAIYQGPRKVDTCATGAIRWAAGSFATGRPSGMIVASTQRVGGLNYVQWEAKAWQWHAARLHAYGDSSPPSVSHCVAAGQRAPVWFLGGDINATYFYTRACTVPAGGYLFIATPSVDCSTVEAPPFHATTDAGLRRCAQSFRPAKSSLALDGTVLSPAGLRVVTSAFTFTMPATNNWLGVPGATSGRAAVAAQCVLLRPLTRGPHTLVRVQQFPGGPVTVTIVHLTVS